MIPLRELITSVRFKVKDPQGATFSDYEIAESVNKAVKLLYSRMGENFIFVAANTTMLVVENGSAQLPLDFHSVKSVKTETGVLCHPTPNAIKSPDQFRIFGDSFHARDGVYRFEYYKEPFSVWSENDTIDAPSSTAIYITEMAAALLVDDTATAEATAQKCCHALAAGNISHFCNKGPLEIWGGIA